MARTLRIDIAGYYHIVNRGVEQRNIFLDATDYKKFLSLVDSLCIKFNIVLHSYCLMTNHYHLLIQTHSDNLPKFMKLLNHQYSIYFNKRYKRVGHLWQGRYKSWYVTDERYLYTLIKYIEYNPIKANMVGSLGIYPFSSYKSFINEEVLLRSMKHSILSQSFTVDQIKEFFATSYDPNEMEILSKSSLLVVASEKKEELDVQSLICDLEICENKQERNEIIHDYYNKGFSQHLIAKHVGLSQTGVYKILKQK